MINKQENNGKSLYSCIEENITYNIYLKVFIAFKHTL